MLSVLDLIDNSDSYEEDEDILIAICTDDVYVVDLSDEEEKILQFRPNKKDYLFCAFIPCIDIC